MKTRTQTPRSTVTTAPFEQRIPWTRIRFKVPSELAEKLNARRERVRKRYGDDIVSACYEAAGLWEETEFHADSKRTTPFEVFMKTYEWERVQATAKDIGASVDDLMIACLFRRERQLRRFDAQQAKRMTAG